MATLSRASGSLKAPLASCLASTSRLQLPQVTTSATRSYATEESPAWGTFQQDSSMSSDRQRAASNAQKADELSQVLKPLRQKGRPFLNSTRHTVLISHPHLWPGKPIKELTIPLRRTGGRNHTGRVASRHIGGGHKRRLRTVDFYRYDSGVHDVIRIEYDPGRSAHIALLKKRAAGAEKPLKALTEEEIEEGMELAETEFGTPQDVKTFVPPHARALVRGGWSYILAPDGLRAGDEVTSFRSGIPVGIVDGWGRPSMDEMDDRMAQTELTRQRIQAEGGIVEPAGPQSVQPIDLKPNPDISSLSHGFLPSPRSLGLLRTAVLKIGNVLPLSLIPTGTVVHNISFGPRGKMQAARSAGCSATIVTHEDSTGLPVGGVDVLRLGGEIQSANGALAKSKGFVQVKMSSGEIRRFLPGSVATIGMVSNKEHQHRVLGKAGRSRWLGRRPSVRGVAMNAVDHPLGGGKGKGKGNKQPVSPTGVHAKGTRTRRPKDKGGNKMVVVERPRGVKSEAKGGRA